jgi:hypothetical protein
MTGWNMPPGVGPGDIPGNGPEDEADEKFWDTVHERCIAAKTPGLVEPVVFLGDDSDPIWTMLNIVRDLAYEVGFREGRAEGELDAAERFAPRDD